MISITISKISKKYGTEGKLILDSIDLNIASGELFFLLGPSGCGKSTLLRIIAGLIEPSSGKILFGNDDVTRLPTEKRQSAMVFQNYALWPHMTLLENVLFGLFVRKTPRADAEKLAREALDMVGMLEYSARHPGELSGGQQQRVALARAMVVRPRVLLLDEPLSNLDAKLRITMRHEIRSLCKTAGLTAIYVTHDQKEALAMADRMAILHEGKLQQMGIPRGIYRRPANVFVAAFIGEGNFVPAKVVGRDGNYFITESVLGKIAGVASGPANFANGDSTTLLIRPESLRIKDALCQNGFVAKIANGIFLGELAQWTFELEKISLSIFEQEAPQRNPGDNAFIHVDPNNVVLL
jgi:iron(III) transport system ATP-binding protein